MKRLPVIMICSRETNRLPVAEVRKLLGCSESLDIEHTVDVSQQKEIYFLYLKHYEQEDELKTSFTLTEAGENFEEKILDAGYVVGGSISHYKSGEREYSSVFVEGKKVGKFKFYTRYFGK